MRFREKIRGKLYAVSVLTEFVRYFSNWSEVWDAYRHGRQLPCFRLRSGLMLAHGEGDEPLYTFREIFENGLYFSHNFYEPSPDDVVIDIGANIGFFTLYLNQRAPGITVHCFEPASPTFERLRTNVWLNRLESRTRLHRYAVSGDNGIAYLAHHQHSVERSLLRESGDAALAEEVESLTLARALSVCGVDHVDMLKIDIEGAEVELILNSKPDTWRQIERVVLEFHGMLRPGCRQVLIDALRERGFREPRVVGYLPDEDRGLLQAER